MAKNKRRQGLRRRVPWLVRMGLWTGLLVALIVVGFFFVLRGGGDGGEGSLPLGRQVQPFELPDVVSGQTFSLSDFFRKKEIVVVSYMGFF